MAQVWFWSKYAHDYVTRDVRNVQAAKREARSWGANRFKYQSRNGQREFSRAHWSCPWQEV